MPAGAVLHVHCWVGMCSAVLLVILSLTPLPAAMPAHPRSHTHSRKGSKEKQCPQTGTIIGVVMLSGQTPAVSGMCGAGMALLSLGLLHCTHTRQGSMDNP